MFYWCRNSANLNVYVSNWNISYVRVIVKAILLILVMYNKCSDYVLLTVEPQTI